MCVVITESDSRLLRAGRLRPRVTQLCRVLLRDRHTWKIATAGGRVLATGGTATRAGAARHAPESTRRPYSITYCTLASPNTGAAQNRGRAAEAARTSHGAVGMSRARRKRHAENGEAAPIAAVGGVDERTIFLRADVNLVNISGCASDLHGAMRPSSTASERAGRRADGDGERANCWVSH